MIFFFFLTFAKVSKQGRQWVSLQCSNKFIRKLKFPDWEIWDVSHRFCQVTLLSAEVGESHFLSKHSQHLKSCFPTCLHSNGYQMLYYIVFFKVNLIFSSWTSKKALSIFYLTIPWFILKINRSTHTELNFSPSNANSENAWYQGKMHGGTFKQSSLGPGAM